MEGEGHRPLSVEEDTEILLTDHLYIKTPKVITMSIYNTFMYTSGQILTF